MNLGVINQGISSSSGYINTSKMKSESSFRVDKEPKCLKTQKNSDIIKNDNSPEISSDNLNAIYDDLAKRYDLTDIKQHDFNKFLDELYENGIITSREHMYAGGIYKLNGPLASYEEGGIKSKDHVFSGGADNMDFYQKDKPIEMFSGRNSDDRFNAVTDYSKSYLDYVQRLDLWDYSVIKDAVIVNNKISEIIKNVDQRK